MARPGRPKKKTAEAVVKDIKRQTRRKFSAEEKIRIVIEGLKGEESIAEICRREGIAPALYYRWSKDFNNNHRYHESLQNLTPADVYFGRDQKKLEKRKSVKMKTMKMRRKQHQLQRLNL